MNKRITWILTNLVIGLVYVSSSALVLEMMVRPTLSAALWPATGVGIAVMVLWGKKAFPGVLLGEILNSIFLYDLLSTIGLNIDTLFDALLIFTGISRAFIASIMYRTYLRESERWISLIKLVNINKFFIYVALIPCLFSTVIYISLLYIEGYYSADTVLVSAVTWYIGDIISVLIFVPIIMAFVAHPREIWRPRIFSVAIPVMFGFVLVVLLYNSTRIHEENNIKRIIRLKAEQVSYFSENQGFTAEGLVEFLEREKEQLKLSDFSIELTQLVGEKNLVLFEFNNNDETSLIESFDLAETITIGDETYILNLSPSEHYLYEQYSWSIWWMVFGGLLLTGFLSGGLLALTGRNALTEIEVNKRTRELDEVNKKLAASNLSYQNLVETQPVIFWKVNIELNKITFVSKEAESILGYPRSLWLEEKDFLQKRIHPDDVKHIKKSMLELYETGESKKLEYRIKHSDGKYRWFRDVLNIHQSIKDQGECQGLLMDITDKKNDEMKIQKLAFKDYLTKLPNRQSFQIKLIQLLAESKRAHHFGALLFLDLDRFKVLNDSLGHHFGDILLVKIAERLNGFKPEVTMLGRFGGDEFVIATKNNYLSYDEAHTKSMILAEKIIETLAKPYQVGQHKHACTASLGIAIYPHNTSTANDIIKQADTAMYRSKKQGRNQLTVYHESMKQDDDQMLFIEQTLRQAIAQGRFFLEYQPIVDRHKQKMAYEALLRIKTQDRTIYPNEFISIAEESGMIHSVGKWVIDHACRKRSASKYKVSINVSSKQFHQQGFISDFKRSIENFGLKKGSIIIELTEGVVVGDFFEILHKFNRLKKMGVLIAIDDFGTGYSSLEYLRKMPLDFLKIDKTFIKDLTEENSSRILIETIVSMAKHLGVLTIAEGVETEQQFDILYDCGCDYFQGFLFGKPTIL